MVDESFRNYRAEARASVRELYRLNHRFQTVEFVRAKHSEFLPKARRVMGIWEAMEFLDTLVDDSDPDPELPQIEHLLQTAEAIRRDGHPRWFVLTGLIHDLGKVLCLFGEPQWSVVGDTFPVGCARSDAIVFAELFADNPDSRVPEYQTPSGIYQPGCGLANVLMSWGHDEYLSHVVNDYLPEEAGYIIRYQSFYPAPRDGTRRSRRRRRRRARTPEVARETRLWCRRDRGAAAEACDRSGSPQRPPWCRHGRWCRPTGGGLGPCSNTCGRSRHRRRRTRWQ